MSRPLHRELRRAIAVVVALLVLVGVAGTLAVRVATDRVQQAATDLTPAIIYNGGVLEAMTTAQTTLRGYTLVGNARALVPYEHTIARVPDRLARLAEALDGDEQGSRLAEAQQEAITNWVSGYVTPELRLAAGTFRRPLYAKGKQLFREIRAANRALDGHLDERLTLLRADADEVRDQLMAATVLLTTLAAGLGLWASVQVSRRIREPLFSVRDTLNQLAAGQHDRRVVPDGPTEVAQIATSVNQLADESARLRAIEEQELEIQERLLAYRREVRNILEPDEVVSRATAELGAVLSADVVYVRMVEDGRIGPATSVWHAPGVEPLTQLARSLVVGSVLGMETLRKEKRSLVVEDTANHPFYDTEAGRRWLAATGARATLMMMISVDDVATGVVTVLSRGPRQWPARDIRVGESITADLGRAVEHARLFAAKVAAVDHLRALDRSKDTFISTVSHELRTPLTSISGYLELLEDEDEGALNDGQRHLLTVIRRNSDRLRQLIEDLLTLSSIESGAFRTLLTDVDVATIMQRVVEDLQPAAVAADVSLTCVDCDIAVHVAGDAGQLSRALLNLADNAIKFTPGGGAVRLSMRVEEGENAAAPRRALLMVTDTGMGIPADDQETLFTRFFRAANATTANIPGTGLGLVIVRTIVENHGGSVRLDSAEGRGTMVRVQLPVSSSAATAHQSAVPAR